MRDKELIIIPAIPKSSSSRFANCICDIQEDNGGAGVRKYPPYMMLNNDSDLRPGIIKFFRRGGVLKYHIPPSGKNLKVLDDFGFRYIILFRHPADVITSIYCNSFNLIQNQGKNLRHSIIHPINMKYFENHDDMNTAINHLICDGYLNAVLLWMTDWVRYRNKDKSLVIRYEDVLSDRKNVFNGISGFFYGRFITKDVLDHINRRYSKKRKDDYRNYPKGWTGKVNTWRDYFSDDNIWRYNEKVNAFLGYYSSILESYYKDLVLR